jgi:peptide chain release factor subunit 1
MADLDRSLLRKLAGWTAAGNLQVVSLYLSVDGRTYPRRHGYEPRLDDMLRRVDGLADAAERDARLSLCKDRGRIERFVKDEFERGATRGLALFSCSGAGLWEDVLLPRPVRDRVEVGPVPHLLPLEAMLETYESFCTVLVDSEKARIFLAELGRIEEEADLWDQVPGRHDQGGWSQSRFQRHIDDARNKHLKRVAEALFRFFKRRRFDHLILGGPDEVVAELERELHDYLSQRVRARIHLPILAPAAAVLERSLAVEEELEREQHRAAVQELLAEATAGRQAVAGLRPVLRALSEARVERLIVAADLQAEGVACPRCGRLSDRGRICEACGAALQPVPDVVEAAVAASLRQGCRVEIVSQDGDLHRVGGIGAILRY